MNSRETAGKKKKSLKEKLEEEADKKGKQQQVWGEVVEEEKADFWQGLEEKVENVNTGSRGLRFFGKNFRGSLCSRYVHIL
ncbi:unnamed protein product [Sphagnum jensenii]|uniref:Uncharacterized protein n=1 Tax=Sphagnum jensenii TaxID=128206 RepID=A0ABP0W841_9BRYO